ncbi:hypothetical protein Cgig2_011424 [Carnegiea gigantea]|uniref:Methyltransferase domain-containing protein n=1 Tax=Carnegiea gigantea TaxID=171969 RepID=A0A9Q1KTV8_9CARY|nr:hypothetical protein Cgig2_011424 [Carnegiea gigantea]
MLDLYCKRAELKDGQLFLMLDVAGDLLFYTLHRITAIIGSLGFAIQTQKAFIEKRCRDLQLQNLAIKVADISTFEMDGSYDRMFSIGMFKHMKNYKDLLRKICNWMKSDGLLFVSHFCHKAFAYHFENVNDNDWTARYFLHRKDNAFCKPPAVLPVAAAAVLVVTELATSPLPPPPEVLPPR